MKRTNKLILQLVLMVCIAAGLIYYYFGVDVVKEEEKKTQEKQEKVFVSIKKDDVEKVVFEKKDQEKVVVKKTGKDEWKVIEPVDDFAEKNAIDAVIISLASAEVQRKFDEYDSLADFGLAEPLGNIEVYQKDLEKPIRVKFGEDSPMGNTAYAMKEGSEAVYSLLTSVKTGSLKELFDVRNKNLIEFEPEKTKEFVLVFADSKIVCSATGEQVWSIKEPVSASADKNEITSLLNKIKWERVKKFVEEAPEDLEKYGLVKPATEITVAYEKEGETITKSLAFGYVDDAEDGVYAKLSGKPTVLLLNKTAGQGLGKTVNDLRDKTVLPFENEKVVKLELKYKDRELLVKKLGEKEWQIQAPFHAPAKEETISSYLWTLKAIKGQSVVLEKIDEPSKYGLDDPDIICSVWEKDKEEPYVFIFGNEELDSDFEKGGYFGKKGDSDTLFLFDKDTKNKLTRSADDWQDKSILNFEKNDVFKFEIKKSDKRLACKNYSGDTVNQDWRAYEPKKDKVENYKASDVIWNLKNLEWKDIVEENSQNLSKFGLDKPAVEVSIYGENDKFMGSLLVGSDIEGKDRRYAMAKGSNTVYSIDKRYFDELPIEISNLQASQ